MSILVFLVCPRFYHTTGFSRAATAKRPEIWITVRNKSIIIKLVRSCNETGTEWTRQQRKQFCKLCWTQEHSTLLKVGTAMPILPIYIYCLSNCSAYYLKAYESNNFLSSGKGFIFLSLTMVSLSCKAKSINKMQVCTYGLGGIGYFLHYKT